MATNRWKGQLLAADENTWSNQIQQQTVKYASLIAAAPIIINMVDLEYGNNYNFVCMLEAP